jgi:hypothetical protein
METTKWTRIDCFNVKKNTILTERNGQNITVYATDSILQNIQKTTQ